MRWALVWIQQALAEALVFRPFQHPTNQTPFQAAISNALHGTLLLLLDPSGIQSKLGHGGQPSFACRHDSGSSANIFILHHLWEEWGVCPSLTELIYSSE